MMTINDAWDDLCNGPNMMLPDPMDLKMKIALRRAFFSGAGLVLSNILEFDEGTTLDEASDVLNYMEDEMREFVTNFMRSVKDRN